MKQKLVLILLAVVANFGYGFAQDGVILSDKTGWHKIGEKTVDFTRDQDEIHVFGANRFAALKFLVIGASIHLNQVKMAFENGEDQNVKLNSQVKSFQESKLIDIKGGERNLKKIIFTYNTLLNRKVKKAQVEIWGLKTNADESNNVAPSPAIIMNDKPGWQKIAKTTVDFKAERDEIMILGENQFQNSRPHANWNHINLKIIFRFVWGNRVLDWLSVSSSDSTALLNLGVDRP